MKFMDSNHHLLLPNHYFCMKCDKKEFSGTEINENLIIDEKAGDIICGQCGDVLYEKLIFHGNESVMYAEDYEMGNNRSRVSGHSEYFGSQETIFVQGPEELRKSLERAQKLLENRREKVIVSNIPLVNDLCCKLNLTTSIKVKAVEIFSEFLVGVTLVVKVRVIAAVSVYLACRVCGYPRLLDEISQASGIESKLLIKYQGVVARKLALPIGIIKPRDIINRMTVQLDWSFTRRQFAFDFCEEINQYELFVTSPPQLVAATIIAWLAVLTTEVSSASSPSSSSERKPLLTSVEDLCRVCFIPPGALRKLFREFFDYLPNIVPRELSDVVGKLLPKLSPLLEKHMDDDNYLIPAVPLPEPPPPMMNQSTSMDSMSVVPLQKSRSEMSLASSSSNQSRKRKLDNISS